MYFSASASKNSDSPINFSAESFMTANPFYKIIGFSLGISYLKLRILCLVPLHLPVK